MVSKTQDPNHTTLDGEAELDQYVLSHSDDEPEYLYRLWRATNIHMLHGRMASGRLQGRLLKMLVQMIRPRNILEIGTFSGYSALCMAEGLEAPSQHLQAPSQPPRGEEQEITVNRSDGVKKPSRAVKQMPLGQELEGGCVYTFEINDEQEDFTRPWIEHSPWADRVRFMIGDAITEAPRLAREEGIMFDMAFLDGDKRTYVDTYEAILPLMPSGAYILADNTLWDGHVTDPAYQRDPQTRGIRAFNDHIMQDDRVTRVILPLRDGLTIIRKK